MGWIVAAVKRIVGWSSPVRETLAGGGTVQSRGDRPEVQGRDEFDEFAKTFDLDQERVRLAEENATLRDESSQRWKERVLLLGENVELGKENSRLWKELIARNSDLEESREETERAANAQALLAKSLSEALDREMEVIAALLPNLEFVRDSREVVRSGLRNRLPLLAVLRELSVNPGIVKGTRVESTEGWLEQHFQTGEGANGRIYFRRSGARCSVLVSFKVAQGADIRYLQGLRT